MTIVRMKISAFEETPPEELKTYCSCVSFMAHWFEKQAGANDKQPPELFEEFKDNVTAHMMGQVEGRG